MTTRDDILVRYRANTSSAERKAVARDLNLSLIRMSRSGRTAVLRGKGVSPATVRRELAGDPRVGAVGQNFRREFAADPTAEQYFKNEWALNNTGQTISGIEPQTGVSDVDIDGLEALRVQQGKPSVVVAVIDDGVDFSHPDLAGRKWTNPGETPGNGVDDDGNGYIDDINGWDFCHDDASVHDAGHDGHGTHVAGTIAASLNGSGVVGVAPGVSIMALKFIDDVDNCGMDDQAIEAIDYAANNGATLINASWGGTGANPVLDQTIIDFEPAVRRSVGQRRRRPRRSRRGLLSRRVERGERPDRRRHRPDGPARRTSRTTARRGSTSSAPGTNILSTFPAQGGCSPCYAWSDGTSMAAPHVTGIAALALSKASGPMSASTLRSLVLASAVPAPGS